MRTRFSAARRWAAPALLAAALCGAAGPARAADMAPRIPITEEILPNGLKVLLIEAPKAPVVSVQLWYRVGSRNEVPGVTGLSHMLEHMMFKVTPSVPIKEYDRLIQKAGGNSNAFTYQDATTYFANLAAHNLELPLRLEADRMRNLLFDEKEFADLATNPVFSTKDFKAVPAKYRGQQGTCKFCHTPIHVPEA